MFTNACLSFLAAAMVPTVALAQSLGQPGSKIGLGYTLETNVQTELNRDKIQKQLEDTMKDEQCGSLAAGKSYYDAEKSSYFEAVPFYSEKIGKEYQLYIDYFGDEDFIKKYVDAAFSGSGVTYENGNGADFSKLPGNTEGSGECVGREEGVKKVLAYTGSYIDMNQYMEQALQKVINGCVYVDGLGNNPCSDALNAWEKALATWSGSIEGEYGANTVEAGKYGKWLQALSGKRCANFKTCGNSDNDATNKGVPSRTGINIVSLFSQGSVAVKTGRFQILRRIISEINKEITVTRIQGVLRYAYRTGILGSTKDKEIAEGAAFAFGLLPQIWACNKESARILAENTDIGSDKTSQRNGQSVTFGDVRAALECNYFCLGIRFDDVGSLNDCTDGECFGKRKDSPNICKKNYNKINLKNKCKAVAPSKKKNGSKAKTRFGALAKKRFS